MNGWTVLIAAHASGAMLALLLGTAMVVRRKGDRVHRRIGRIWMGAMYWVVLSSFGITRLRPGHLSWIHGLSVWTFVSLTMAWRAARAGDVRKHRGWAIGSFGGLLGAFAGAVAVPVRLIPRTVVHQPLAASVAFGVVGLVGYLLVKASGAGRATGRTERLSDLLRFWPWVRKSAEEPVCGFTITGDEEGKIRPVDSSPSAADELVRSRQ